MPVFPLLSERKAVQAFEKLGWQVARQRGSRVIMVNSPMKGGILHSSTFTATSLRGALTLNTPSAAFTFQAGR